MSERATAAPAKAKKPVRVWLLQLTCALETGRTGYTAVTEAMTNGAPRTTADYVWWGSVVLGVILAVALIVSAQRWTPRPAVTAPVVGAARWLDGIRFFVDRELDPERRSPNDAQLAGGIIGHALMLFLAASLIAHRKTRDYLAGRPPRPAAAP